MHRRAARAIAATATTVALLAGCAGQDDGGGDAAPSATVTSAEATDGGTAVPGPEADVPDTAPGRATQWVLDQLAASAGPDETEAAERFAPVFLDQVPADQVAAVFDQLRAEGPFTLTGYSEAAGSAQGELVGADGARFLLSVGTDDDELVQGLFLQPAPEIPDITTPEDADTALADTAEESSMLLARVTGDGEAATCEPVHARDAGELRPIGSIFKLYVLAAVVDAVAAGDLAWDDTLTLTDDLRSLPSGTLQEEPTGTEVSVREAADAMIAISDNTATDLLIDAVGRDRVEAAVSAAGHGQPEVITPFLTTREMFQLAFTDPDLRARWVASNGGDPLSPDPQVNDAQRTVLQDLPGGAIELDETLASAPAWTDGLDWFATATDLCAAHLHLQHLAGTDAGEPVQEILAQNPGLTGAQSWDYAGFKGGSSVGEIAGSWYVEGGDGERYVLVLQAAAADPAGVPDGTWLFSVAGQTLDTLRSS